MAFQIESTEWIPIDGQDPNFWEPCLKKPTVTLDEAMGKLAEFIRFDVSVNMSYPYRIVEV